MSFRMQRLNAQFLEEISQIIQFEIKDPRVNGTFVTVLEVNISPDLNNAKVYVSVMDGEKFSVIEGLTHSVGFIRGILGKRIHIRKIPILEFVLDESEARASKINEILDRISSEQNGKAD